jgi:ABC-type multidrug transport system fused ATPase/permease subunit
VVANSQALVGLGLALATSWKLALIIFSAIPVVGIGAMLVARPVQGNLEKRTSALAVATKLAYHCITNFVVVKCFNTHVHEACKYADGLHTAAKYALKQSFSMSMQIGFVRFATTAMFVPGKSRPTCTGNSTR